MASSQRTEKLSASQRDEALVRRYTRELRNAGEEMAEFDVVFDRLQADKRVRFAELIAISQRYTGSKIRPMTKTLAFAAISSAFVERVRALRR